MRDIRFTYLMLKLAVRGKIDHKIKSIFEVRFFFLVKFRKFWDVFFFKVLDDPILVISINILFGPKIGQWAEIFFSRKAGLIRNRFGTNSQEPVAGRRTGTGGRGLRRGSPGR